MGKGDQRSRRGKIWRVTFGKRRPKKTHAAAATATPPPAEEVKKRGKKEPEGE